MSIHNAHVMQNGREFKLLLLNCLAQKILPVTSIFSLGDITFNPHKCSSEKTVHCSEYQDMYFALAGQNFDC